MSRRPLPEFCENTGETYVYVGGVDNYDLWARYASAHHNNEWDLYFLDAHTYACWGADVFISSDLSTNFVQQGALKRMQEAMGEDGFRRAALLLRCFAPYLFTGKLWPAFHKKNLRDIPNKENIYA